MTSLDYMFGRRGDPELKRLRTRITELEAERDRLYEDRRQLVDQNGRLASHLKNCELRYQGACEALARTDTEDE